MERLTDAQRAQVADNIGLAHKVVDMLERRHPRVAPHRDDLLQDGIMGLMRAASGFDPALGYAFSTYAWYWISQHVNEAARRALNPVSGGRSGKGVTRSVYVERGDMPRDLVAETPDMSSDDWLDLQRLGPGLLDAIKYPSRGSTRVNAIAEAKRDADIFVRAVFGDEHASAVGKEYGLYRERSRLCKERARGRLNALTRKVRAELDR